ncbi:Probable pectinesterase/pectinesterase inhibitor 41 [Striga hermonthica]|uniref:Pectinesterase n=1 Tax=Striga hermonthica TaxID=68872 RepID=A0A9N7NJQ7_STRHE|nr:Probable pectinesterase/pectinesterase inhibitor 41 [Striga hermonthica]
MPKNPLHSQFTTLSILIIILPLIAFSQPNSPNPTPLSTICKSTPYPSFCNTILSDSNSSANIYDYGRFSIHKSLTSARNFLSLIQKYLQESKTLTVPVVRALQDCEFLAQCNLDYLTSSSQILDRNSQTLPDLEADDVQTLLSAILTNIETCTDSLQSTASAWSVTDNVLTLLYNDTRLYSVSLALFTQGWVSKGKTKKPVFTGFERKRLKSVDGRFNLRMHGKTLEIYRNVSHRRLLQSGGDSNNQVQVSNIVIVSKDGTGNFSTINDAVRAAPTNANGTNGYFLIYIKGGVYEEYVSIASNKKYLMMLGDGINQTIITGNHSVGDGWTTFNSATFAVVAPNFIAADITFRNTAGPAKSQAVAVRNGADLSAFYYCSFEAYQDTLYAHSLRQFYRDCTISGTVDFVFGNAAAVLQSCNILPRLPLPGQFNPITAQGRTDPNQNTGTSVHGCNITAAPDLAASNATVRTYLGRPWKQYSRVVYMESFMGSLIDPAGWRAWSGDFALNTSYYAEFNNTGPGSNTSARVTWPGFHVIDRTTAENFTVSSFLLGDYWLPQTGVPYIGGLFST